MGATWQRVRVRDIRNHHVPPSNSQKHVRVHVLVLVPVPIRVPVRVRIKLIFYRAMWKIRTHHRLSLSPLAHSPRIWSLFNVGVLSCHLSNNNNNNNNNNKNNTTTTTTTVKRPDYEMEVALLILMYHICTCCKTLMEIRSHTFAGYLHVLNKFIETTKTEWMNI